VLPWWKIGPRGTDGGWFDDEALIAAMGATVRNSVAEESSTAMLTGGIRRQRCRRG
jgi:hypothetical protein